MDNFIKEEINGSGLFSETEIKYIMEHFNTFKKIYLLGVIDA